MTARARAVPIPSGRPVADLSVVVGTGQRRPHMGAWVLLTFTVFAAFLLLIYSRIALDRSAFVLEEVGTQMQLEEARYWELRLEAAHLQAPERITELAAEMGMVYPDSVRTIEVPGIGAAGSDIDDRWVDLKALLGTTP